MWWDSEPLTNERATGYTSFFKTAFSMASCVVNAFSYDITDRTVVPMIRPTLEADSETLAGIATGTGVFKSTEIDALRALLDYFHKDGIADGHRAVACERGAAPVGFAYFAPTDPTQRTWHLYWIFVGKAFQSLGVGTELLAFVEGEISRAGGRLLLIETSSLLTFERTRAFYLKNGYEREATIRDFYGEGEDQVVFRKLLLRR